jgi:hypothetical protein
MKMRKFLYGLVLISGVAACSVTEPSTINDVHTGVKAGVSREFVSSKNASSIVRVQVASGTASGQRTHLLKIRRNASFSQNAFYNSAYSYGQQLPYSYGGADVLFCGAVGCDVVEWGTVQLTDRLFQHGLQHGLELRLIGSGDNTLLTVPREAFQQAVAVAPS